MLGPRSIGYPGPMDELCSHSVQRDSGVLLLTLSDSFTPPKFNLNNYSHIIYPLRKWSHRKGKFNFGPISCIFNLLLIFDQSFFGIMGSAPKLIGRKINNPIIY